MARRSDEDDDGGMEGYRRADVAFFTRLAEAAAEAAINRMFIAFGINPKEPLEVQQFFHVLRAIAATHGDEEAKLDAAFVRNLRKLFHGLLGKVIAAAAVLVVGSALKIAWDGFRMALK